MNPIDSSVTVRVNTREYSQKARAQALIVLLSSFSGKQARWKADFVQNGICKGRAVPLSNHSELKLLEYKIQYFLCYVHIQIANGEPDRRSI